MRVLDMLLYIVAVVCFILATFNVPVRVNLVALGLLAWVLVPAIALARTF